MSPLHKRQTWGGVSGTSANEPDPEDDIGITHRVISKNIPEELSLEECPTMVHYVCKISVKEEIPGQRSADSWRLTSQRGNDDSVMSQTTSDSFRY